jgi:hypothetical protein
VWLGQGGSSELACYGCDVTAQAAHRTLAVREVLYERGMNVQRCRGRWDGGLLCSNSRTAMCKAARIIQAVHTATASGMLPARCRRSTSCLDP